MYKQLTSEQRYTISVLLQKKMSMSFIAQTINVSKSTVSREIKRNSNAKGHYNSHLAEMKTRRRKSKAPGNRSIPPQVRCRVFCLIRDRQWSAEQISGRLRREGIQVSKSTIYNWIHKCSAHYPDNIRKYLRHKGKKYNKAKRGYTCSIPDRVMIDERPNTGFGMSVGDWEMDTIVGKGGKGVIVTLVDRFSSFMMMRKLQTGKKAQPLAVAVINMFRQTALPVRTITTDNGTEFAQHALIAKALKTHVYFAHPYTSWKKGAIENMNGLIRQYIPKKADFNNFTKQHIMNIQNNLNNRPRKKNNFLTPNEIILQDIT